MAGLAEHGSGRADTFWTWREAMYRFALALEPEQVAAIAAQLYVEMLETGFTAVGEFHYLHHGRDGRPYAAPAAMAEAVLEGAGAAGIGLFKDAYIRWEEEEIMDWLVRYWEKARKAGLPVREDFGEFYRDYEMMGVQRHIKVLGIFARLYHRDGKDGYLKDMPLVMNYLRQACERYIDLKPLLVLLMELEIHAQQTGTSV